DTLVLAEANAEPQELTEYFGTGDRLPMLFNFLLNQQMFLGLARGDAGPILTGLAMTPPIPQQCQWATFLRNHDEIDLGRLTDVERDEVLQAFGPEPEMQAYGRGIRRRLAPMLGGDRRMLELAYSLQFTLPGTPVLRYGDEIGMGDDLTLKERDAVRTPMQWSDFPNAGFSTADAGALRRPVIDKGQFGYPKVNVATQRRDPHSLLTWMERALHTLRECPEFAVGAWKRVESGERSVLALRYDTPSGVMLAFTNLADEPRQIDLADQLVELEQGATLTEVFGDGDYGDIPPDPRKLKLNGYGYRWIRLHQPPA
ncbi:MAG TPA: hypothetical protein VM942_02020, partial [Acidimicrobiales bacterium]|nr:hypothetical protein [Acidimicrobiales bacterium]